MNIASEREREREREREDEKEVNEKRMGREKSQGIRNMKDKNQMVTAWRVKKKKEEKKMEKKRHYCMWL